MCPQGFNLDGLTLTPEILPLPEAAMGIPIDPEKGFGMVEVAEGTWVLTGGIYVIMFVVTSEGVVLFDAPETVAVRITFKQFVKLVQVIAVMSSFHVIFPTLNIAKMATTSESCVHAAFLPHCSRISDRPAHHTLGVFAHAFGPHWRCRLFKLDGHRRRDHQ